MKWLADENLRNAIIRGLLRHQPSFDIVRAQDLPELSGHDDLTLLRFATSTDRVLLTHDLSTMVSARRTQLRLHSRCAPIVLIHDSLSISHVIEDLLLLDQCSEPADWSAGILYLPLR